MLPSAKQPRPWVIAHRGFSAAYPENTIAAFDAAMNAPTHGIEFDVQLSADGEPVVYHDRTLRMIGGGYKRVRDLTLDQLKAHDYGRWFHRRWAGEPLPKLNDVLARYGHRTLLLLEIKRRERNRLDERVDVFLQKIIDAVRRHDLAECLCVLCFDLDILNRLHQQAPDIKCVWNQKRAFFDPEADFLFAYSVNIAGLEGHFVRAAHQAGKPVFTFTCNGPRQLRRALYSGVDAIMSDDPRWLDEAIAKQARTLVH